MKVTINNHELTIGWNYESQVINKIVAKKGLNRDSFNGKNKKEVAEMLGLKSYPLPDSTHCIITDTITGDRFVGTVKRWHKDPWSREQARKNALTKAVWQLFPEKQNKEQSAQRRIFWNAYHRRKNKDAKAIISKCLKTNMFTLRDLDEYVKSKETLVHSTFH